MNSIIASSRRRLAGTREAATGRGTRRGLRAAALCAAAVVGAAAPVALPADAWATPSSGVTARIISQHTVNGKDYVLREITIAPGGTTGWHYHDGTLYAVVTAGTLTHYTSDCSVDGVYHRGNHIEEPSGAGNVHVGRNLGPTPVTLIVRYVNPAGSPLSEDAPNPGCSFE